MTNKLYSNKQTVFLNIEGNVKEQLEELCFKERKTLTNKIQDLIKEEIQKKEIGLMSNPIAVSYSATMPNNIKHKRLISVFEDSANTKTDVFHMLKDEKVDNDDLNKLHNYCTNFLGGISAYRPNIRV